MTTANFSRALEIILQEEGGFVNDPHDPGGATNLGVTLNTYQDWVGHPVSISEMQALTAADVGPIYKARYWDAVKGDELPSGVDLITFDGAVNCGPGRASKWLQEAAGATPDGAIGPATLSAVDAAKPAALIDSISVQRGAYYHSLSTFDRFGKGWMSRLKRVTATAHEWSAE